jgi:hypothetical protein
MKFFAKLLKLNIFSFSLFIYFLFFINSVVKSEDRYGDYLKHRYFKYVDQIGTKIMRLVDDSKNKIYIPKENTPYCKSEEGTFGYVNPSTGVVGICTNRILTWGGTLEEEKLWINETVRHEAVHAAQFCEYPDSYPLGVSRKKLEGYPENQVMPRDSWYSKQGLSYKDKVAEMEGFYGELNPFFVMQALNKHCY